MTKQELIEKVAQELSKGRKQDWSIEDYRKQAITILALIKEALPELAKEEKPL